MGSVNGSWGATLRDRRSPRHGTPLRRPRKPGSGDLQLGRRGAHGGATGRGGRRAELDLAGELAALFDHDLAVTDAAGDLARRVDDELLADGEVAVERATDLGDVDLG